MSENGNMKPADFPQYVFGGDSSVWDDDNNTEQRPDFLKAFGRGWWFNYIRATFGLSVDSDFKVNWENSRKTLLLLGAYGFLVWDKSPEQQAQVLWNTIKDDPGELPIIVDFEWWSVIPSNAFDLLYRYLEELKRLIKASGKTLKNGKPIRCGIYTAYSFWKQYGKTDAYWAQYILWLARYEQTPPSGVMQIPLPWIKCDFWQFSGHGDGIYYGMESRDVDLDFYMGSMKELLALCGIDDYTIPETDPQPEPKEEGADNMLKMKCMVGALNIRSAPNTNGTVVGVLLNGAEITVYDVAGISGAWVKISATENKWCCVQNSYGTYLQKI